MNIQHNRNVTQDALTSDLRWQALYRGLNQLTTDQLCRIVSHVANGGGVVCDSFNYDVTSGDWCPLAIGLAVPELVAQMHVAPVTNEWAKTFITEVGKRTCPGFTLNPISGVPGEYYRHDRVNDIVRLCHYIINQRRER